MFENKAQFNQSNVDISVKFILESLIKEKIILFSTLFLFSAVSVLYALSLPNIYRSTAVIIPIEKAEQASALRSLSGIASIAGAQIPSSGSRANEAYNLLYSQSLFKDFLLVSDDILPTMFGVEEWVAKENKIIFDPEIYIKESNTWTREVSFPKKPKPSEVEAHLLFHSLFLTISMDEVSEYITLHIDHQSPYLAQYYLESLIFVLNKYLRDTDREIARRAVEYLNIEISKTNIPEIKNATSQLIKSNIEKLMLSEIREEYLFRTIEKPTFSEFKFKPRRSLICFIGFFAGLFLAIILCSSRQIFKQNKI